MQDKNIKQIENREWIASLDWVIEHESKGRAKELLELLKERAKEAGLKVDGERLRTDYRNTIPAEEEKKYPGNLELEQKIYNAIRWNAMAIVARANKKIEGIGGHISTYSSASTLWEVGLHHFFHSYGNTSPGLVYFQGHASPGLYARSYVEHRFDEAHLDYFRREVNNEKGLSSYPHPRLMPDYWRFPTVSMGLAPIQAIYQARFQKYLHHRGLLKDGESPGCVWAMLGDGEMDEPESTGAITLAAREKLDNLIFVINCNLQRLDGPVRGNTKVISELEGLFRGAGWTVIKVIWGSGWDGLFREDKSGALLEKFNELPDGELQRLSRMNAGEMREEFFTGKLKGLVEDKKDEELNALVRGGHDFKKIYNAYRTAVDNTEGPTVILAQTVKGWEQGEAGEASNVAHKTKKVEGEALKAFRDSLELDISDKELEKLPYRRFEKDSEEYKYLMERRKELGGPLPQRKVLAEGFEMPDESVFEEFYQGSDGEDVATTMAFVKMLSKLLGDEKAGKYIVPIIPDESRTFGMDALFREVGIYAPQGQQYEPVDKDSLLYYNESESGAILEEGITEAGSMSSFIAAGTNHTTHPFFTIPFFAFYSMFGFQRVGDLIWAAADARARGFLIGGISGRTSLSGEGLQHTDGQSHLYAMAYPNVRAYDPAFAFELAHIIRDGLRRMYAEGEDIMYYITITNQAYPMPEQPEGITENLLKGLYRFRKSKKKKKKEGKANLLGSGAVMTEVLEAAELLEDNYGFPVDVWSATSYKALYDDARDTERRNMRRRTSDKNHIEKMLDDEGPVFVAATDYVKALPLSISQWVPGDFSALGADGFGRSDTVKTLRRHFEVDAIHIAYHALCLLMEQGRIEEEDLADFAEEYELKPDKENPAKY